MIGPRRSRARGARHYHRQPGGAPRPCVQHITWTAEEIARLAKLRAAGETYKKMAEALGRSLGAISGKINALAAKSRVAPAAAPPTGGVPVPKTAIDAFLRKPLRHT